MDKRLIGVAFELVGLILACIYIGKIFDEKYALNGLGIAGGAVVGFFAWVTHVVFIFREKDSK